MIKKGIILHLFHLIYIPAGVFFSDVLQTRPFSHTSTAQSTLRLPHRRVFSYQNVQTSVYSAGIFECRIIWVSNRPTPFCWSSISSWKYQSVCGHSVVKLHALSPKKNTEMPSQSPSSWLASEFRRKQRPPCQTHPSRHLRIVEPNTRILFFSPWAGLSLNRSDQTIKSDTCPYRTRPNQDSLFRGQSTQLSLRTIVQPTLYIIA